MSNHEKALDAHASAAGQNYEVTQKLHDDVQSAPTVATPKPIVQPSDQDIRKLLKDPEKFQKLYDKYYTDLCEKHAEPQQDDWISKDSLEEALENPMTKADERLIAAAELAVFDHLGNALGDHLSDSGELVLDQAVGDQYEKYMGGASKATMVSQIEYWNRNYTNSFGDWINSSDNSWAEHVSPILGAGAALATGTGIYGAALVLGAAPAVGLAVVGGAAAAVGITFAQYEINKVSNYLHASSKYESTLKQLQSITQSASLPPYERNIQ